MGKDRISRRDAMLAGGAMVAGLAFLRLDRLVAAAPLEQGEVVVTWLDQPAAVPPPAQAIIGQQLQWEELDSWITPTNKFFTVKHFGQSTVDPQKWRLDITGLVKQPLSLTIDQLKARPRQEVTFTLECSGNTGLPFFWGGVGNATWAGAALAPLLQEAGILDGGKEIVFYAHDIGKQKVRDMDLTTPFARSMSVTDAMSPGNLLCYEMNGQPLEAGHGAPLRLLTPGWYGVANVKWLNRVEVIETALRGALHRPRLRDHPRGAARRPAVLDRDRGRQGTAQVSPGSCDPEGRQVPDCRRGMGRPSRQGRRAG